jgi:hypothetical protein
VDILFAAAVERLQVEGPSGFAPGFACVVFGLSCPPVSAIESYNALTQALDDVYAVDATHMAHRVRQQVDNAAMYEMELEQVVETLKGFGLPMWQQPFPIPAVLDWLQVVVGGAVRRGECKGVKGLCVGARTKLGLD